MTFEPTLKWAEQPWGMRDLYPRQAKFRRVVENLLLGVFEKHGFDMVSSGALEYVDTLLRGRRREEADEWHRLVDPNGRMVALRPEMTPSIARMAAPLLRGESREIRWCYAEKVFRRSTDPVSLSWASAKAAESTQVGVEWIGTSGPAADAAVLALCQNAIAELNMDQWQVVVSHAQLSGLVLEILGVHSEDRQLLTQYLMRGDYVGFRERHRQSGYAGDVLSVLAALNPFQPESLPESIRSGMAEHARGAHATSVWEELVALADVLRGQGMSEHVSFDFTLVRDLSYYTGIVFEVFTPGVGAPIALGGRYDALLSEFGADAPAIGFTFEVERLLAAIQEPARAAEFTNEGGGLL